MKRNTKDRLIVIGIVFCGLVGFLGTMIGAAYLANNLNNKIQQAITRRN